MERFNCVSGLKEAKMLSCCSTVEWIDQEMQMFPPWSSSVFRQSSCTRKCLLTFETRKFYSSPNQSYNRSISCSPWKQKERKNLAANRFTENPRNKARQLRWLKVYNHPDSLPESRCGIGATVRGVGRSLPPKQKKKILTASMESSRLESILLKDASEKCQTLKWHTPYSCFSCATWGII